MRLARRILASCGRPTRWAASTISQLASRSSPYSHSFGVTIAVGHGPVVTEVVSAVAGVRIDDLVNEYVQEFFETRPHTSVTRNIVKRGEGFHQAEMPVVGFPSE